MRVRRNIHPAASGDSGGAVGAAFYFYNAVLGKPRNFLMEHAYWGEEYGPREIEKFLAEKKLAYEKIEDDEKLFARIVESLIAGKVIGWTRGS